MKISRRIGMTVVSALTMVALTIGLASAHECFNASRSARANSVIAQHAHGWFDIQTAQFLAIGIVSCLQQPAGDCPPTPPLSSGDLTSLQTGDFDALVGEILGFAPAEPAVTNLLAFTSQVEHEAACLGVPTHFLTLANATGAGGTERRDTRVTADGTGIDHFPEVYGEQLYTAFATVLQGGQSACQ